MNVLALLNPMDELEPGTKTSMAPPPPLTGPDTAFVAQSLMRLGGHDAESCSRSEPTPSPPSSSVAMRSPLLPPARVVPLHLSPMAQKLAPTMPWTAAAQPTDKTAMPRRSVVVAIPSALLQPLAPAPPPHVQRRLGDEGNDAQQAPALGVGPRVAPLPNLPLALLDLSDAKKAPECSVTGCLRGATHHGKCPVHKSMKLCQVHGCFRPVQSRGCCKSHGGGARCKHAGCTKGAISKGRCRAHGGGTRCAVPNCVKWAQRFGCCVRHSKIPSNRV